MENIKIFFDMDQVLADFDGALENDKLQRVLKQKWHDALKKHHKEDIIKLSKDQVKKLFKGPQTDPTMKALKKVWYDYNNYTYVVANRPGFFLNLEELPGSKELFQLAYDLTGNLPDILTAPIESNPNCEKEKLQWVSKHFPGMWEEFHCTLQKQQYAAPNHILIDDRTKYIEPFEANGGHVVLYKNAQQAMSDLKKVVEELKNEPVEEEDLLKELIKEVIKHND